MRTTVQIALTSPAGPIRKDRSATWAKDGLAVTRSVNWHPAWTVTHVASGYVVMDRIYTARGARIVAERLLALGDWTRSRTVAKKDRVLHDGARALRDQLRDEGLVAR